MECTYLTAHSLFDCASGYCLFEAFKYSQNSDVFWLWLLNPKAMHTSKLCIRCRGIKANTSSRQNVSPRRGFEMQSHPSAAFTFASFVEWNSSAPPGLRRFSSFPAQWQTARLTLHGSIPTSSFVVPVSSLRLSLSSRLPLRPPRRRGPEVTAPLAAIINPPRLYYWWRALKMFIAPSELYLKGRGEWCF